MLFWLTLSLAFAADRHVPGTYASIGSALGAANPGDTVVIAAGTYCEDVSISVDVTLQGAGRDLTTIDGACSTGTSAVSVHNDVILRDLTVDGDYRHVALKVYSQATVVAERVSLVHGNADFYGGKGGGILAAENTDVTCDECVLCGNESVDDGGGVYFDGDLLTLRRSVVVANQSGDAGGGVYVDSNSDAVLDHTTFVANAAATQGQGLRVRDFTAVTVTNSIFAEHSAGTAIEVASFGYVQGSHNLFYGNQADATNTVLNTSLTGDPMFTSTTLACDALDLTLQPGSAAMWAAGPAQLFDDIGAYDFDDDVDGDGWTFEEDCDDNDPEVHPGASEVCGGGDEDCDGQLDEDDPSTIDLESWFADDDGDGYGAGQQVVGCVVPYASADIGGDCNDADGRIHPYAVELCDRIDQNCSGVPDEGLPDTDLDGVCDDLDLCTGDDAGGDDDGDGFCADVDCHDGDDQVFPGAEERCNGVDDDCDTASDEAGAIGEQEWFPDADHDDFGDPSRGVIACDPGPDYVLVADDCNDTDATVYPGAEEYCDAVDRDCDGTVGQDEPDIETVTWYLDSDLDGYGDEAVSIEDCAFLAGYARSAGDCDDGAAEVNPEAEEICGDGVDQDCSGADLACPDTGLGAGDTGDTGDTNTTGIPGTGTDTSTDTGAAPGTLDTGSTTGGGPSTEPTPTGSDTTPAGGTDAPSATPASTTGGVSTEGLAPACGCQGAPGGAGLAWIAGLVLVWRRRRAAVGSRP